MGYAIRSFLAAAADPFGLPGGRLPFLAEHSSMDMGLGW